MTKTKVIFCGSFLEYSSWILTALITSSEVEIIGVLTTPSHLNQKTNQVVKNPVQVVAETHNLPVFTPTEIADTTLPEIEETVGKPELLITAGYGKLLPPTWLSWPTIAALNLHFSLLPKFRGANPAEWAFLLNEKITGVTLIEMSPEFDTGKMVASASLNIKAEDTRETLYAQLYHLGAEKLATMVSRYVAFRQDQSLESADSQITWYLPPQSQPPSPTPYANRFQRDDGFVTWSGLQSVFEGKTAPIGDFSQLLQKALKSGQLAAEAAFVERAIRALRGFPSLWTLIPTTKGPKRLKLLSSHLENQRLVLDEVHVEGKSPSQWSQVKNILQETT